MPDQLGSIPQPQDTLPNYADLVGFLVQPFLEVPESLRVDCEMSQGNSRVWIRLAFEGEDKGRVFGRGGRNIQAIRTVIEAAAQAASQSVYLDIYGSSGSSRESESGNRTSPDRSSSPRSSPPKAPPKTRSR